MFSVDGWVVVFVTIVVVSWRGCKAWAEMHQSVELPAKSLDAFRAQEWCCTAFNPTIASESGQIQRVMNGVLIGMHGISLLGPWEVSTGLSCNPWCGHLVIGGGVMPGIMDVDMTGGKTMTV